MTERTGQGVHPAGILSRLPAVLVQYAKFGVIGGLATLTHSLVFVIQMEVWAPPPLMANLLAYGVAVFISYFGNYRWTFGAGRASAGSFLRFLTVSLLGLTLNSIAVWGIMNLGKLPYPYVLPFMLLVVPVVVFVLNRRWTFRNA